MMKVLPHLSKAYRLFSQEETHKEIAQNTTIQDPLAFAIAHNKPYNQSFKTPHYKPYQPSILARPYMPPRITSENHNKRPASSYYCSHCKVSGHSYERCFKVHGYPPGFKGFKDKRIVASVQSQQSPTSTNTEYTSSAQHINIDQYNYLLEVLNSHTHSTSITEPNDDPEISSQANLAGNICLLSCSISQWIIDSGAIDHICNDLNLFISSKPFSGSIIISDGKRIPISHIGTVLLNSKITLHNILHAPAFQYNLLSVTKLCLDLSSTIFFTNKACFIQEHSLKGPPTLLGNLAEGLYQFKHSLPPPPSPRLPTAHTSKCTSINKAKLWHLRLGHIPFSQLKHVVPDCLVTDFMQNQFCQICPLAKQTRHSFPTSLIKSTRNFQLLHIDLWGPYRINT